MNYDYSTDDLMSLQIKLEEDMTTRGLERYLRDVAKARQSNREEGTAYGQQILSSRLQLVSDAIKAWMEETSVGRAGNNALAYKRVKDMHPDVLAFLTLKVVLSGISAARTLQFVAAAIGQAVEDELRLSKIRETERREFDRLVNGAKKRSAYHYKHAYAVRRAERVDDWEKWTTAERLHVGIKLVDILMATIGLVEITHQKIQKEQSVKYLRPLPETIEWIEKKNEATSVLRPVYEPMVVQPRDWTNPFDGGYLSSNIKPLRLVKTRQRTYLSDLKDVEMPIVYEAINALQRTPWQINSQILKVMSELWENGSVVAGLPPRDGVEMPPRPHDIDTNEEARKEYRIASAKAHMQNLSMTGKRIAFNISLNIAKRYEKYRRIFFPYQLDFRGRIYAVPHLNPQGADHQKALLRFANGKPLGSEGWKWLAIHGANVAGYDKVSFEDRVNWVFDNEEEIVAIARDPFTNRGWSGSIGDIEIDKPWQFLAFCFEWAGFCEHGEEFVSKIPVAMDGSCSGLQHFSAMLRDERGGASVNLVPSELPADVYQQVANKVIEMVKADLETGTDDQVKHTEEGTAYVQDGTKKLAQQWLEFGITRKTCKRSVMTLAYGSKEYGFKEQLMSDIITPARLEAQKVGGSFPFSRDGYQAAQYMAKKIWLAVNETLIKASEAMKWLQSVASLAASENLPVRWTTPIGFPVVQAYRNVKSRRIDTAISGKVMKLTLNEEQEKLDRRAQAQGVSPNVVHSADAAHLMLTVVRATQEGIHNFAMIHDSFGTTAGDVEQLFRIVREAFVEMYETVNVLEDFAEDIREQLSEKNQEKMPPIPSSGHLDISRVMESRYCFA